MEAHSQPGTICTRGIQLRESAMSRQGARRGSTRAAAAAILVQPAGTGPMEAGLAPVLALFV